MSVKNPITYCFNFAYDTVRKTILNSLYDYKFESALKRQKETENNDEQYYPHGLTFETSSDAVFSKNIFKNAENKNDIYFHSFGSLSPSTVYYSKDYKTPLEFKAEYQIKLEKISDTITKVSIITLNYKVITGYQRIPEPGMCGFWKPPIECDLPITTVEEYELLLKIGQSLGAKNMPEMKIPAKICLTRKGKVI